MRVRLKGLNKITKTLANGQKTTYFYAWKGGPRLPGKPGDTEFMAAYNEAVAATTRPRKDVLQAVLTEYQASPEFAGLKPRTRKDYIINIRKIEAAFSDFPLAALKEQGAKKVFIKWRNELAKTSPRQADYAVSTLAAILAWALNEGTIAANPCVKMGKLYKGTRAEKIWSREQEAMFRRSAPERMILPFLLATWLGQRQGDLLRLTWSAYDGTFIRLQQGKTDRRVVIPVGSELKAELDRLRPKDEADWSQPILKNTRGEGWTSDGFRTEWGKAVRDAKVKGVTFHDLRGTAVTRLALAGCSNAEIATFTGHSLEEIAAILDTHYLNRDLEFAKAALRKRETYEAARKSTD